MNLKEKRKKLRELYDQYEKEVAEFKKASACEIGCADCCIDVGNIDITTLEGIIIHEQMNSFGEQLSAEIKNRLAKNKAEREEKKLSRCAFLNEDKLCIIYDIRPFSCRQLYSVKRCDGASPTIHLQAVETGKQIRKKIQQLDLSGYSGHTSYILYLLDKESFRKRYLSGKSDPKRIIDFGRSHGILINRYLNK
jgi:Fe-S-cluster containining protein